MNEKLQNIINMNKGDRVKINYAQLKKHLNYEDMFYELILLPMCEENGVKISFQKEFVVLDNREEI